MYYLGVDGGGSKTRYILTDENMKIIYDIKRETTHIQQIGKEKLETELTYVRERILSENNIEINDIKGAFFGMPGYGEIQSDKEYIDEIIEKVFGGINYRVGNDGEVSWAAGTGCSVGINIVAGTGSIAFGKNSDDEFERCGGWGPGIGDEGSAYYIGLKVIREYTKQKDGRSEKSILIPIIEGAFGIDDYFEIVDIVFNVIQFSRTEIAKFSKYGAIAASDGCKECIEIFRQAGVELAKHIISLSKKLKLNNGFIVSYSGGVFNSGSLVLSSFKKELLDREIQCKVIKPKLKPWEGAILLAMNI